MSYRWEPVSGSFATSDLEAAGLLQKFDDQVAAEEWLSLFFDDLIGQGVAGVSLYEEDRLIYGPMSLRP